MRRREREVTDRTAVEAVLSDGEYCTLSLSKGGEPYAIPMNYGYSWEGDALKFYFHCAHEGEKMDILRQGDRACVSIVAAASIYAKDPELGCSYSSHYRSFVAQGRIAVLEGLEAKGEGLVHLMKHYAPEKDFTFGERECEMVTVLCFRAERWSAKESKPKPV